MAQPATRWAGLLSLPAPRRAVTDVIAVLVALVLGLGVGSTLVWRTAEVGPLTLSARMSFGWPGRTEVHVPPFGTASARTHTGFARLSVTVDEVDIPRVERLLERTAQQAATDLPALRSQAAEPSQTVAGVLERESLMLRGDIASLVVLAALAAAAVSALVMLAFRRRAALVIVTGVSALVFVLVSAGLAVATYDVDRLAEPRLEGALAYVPRLEALFSTRLMRIEELRGQVADVANDLAAYYADPRSIQAGGGLPDTFRVLHVSDLHLDPVGAELARSLVRSYEASLVIDTGDIAILGTAEEAALLPSLVVTDVPVVFVPGNHDSENVIEALSALPNFTVATSETVEAQGLRVFPLPDPAGAEPGIEPDPAAIESATQDAVARLVTEEASGVPPPDIIALHNPGPERALVGRSALILSGHTHSGRIYRSDGSLRVNSGTLGGMPYDPVESGRRRLPHGASVLYFTSTLPRQLIAVDRISVGVDGRTTLERTVVNESLLP